MLEIMAHPRAFINVAHLRLIGALLNLKHPVFLLHGSLFHHVGHDIVEEGAEKAKQGKEKDERSPVCHLHQVYMKRLIFPRRDEKIENKEDTPYKNRGYVNSRCIKAVDDLRCLAGGGTKNYQRKYGCYHSLKNGCFQAKVIQHSVWMERRIKAVCDIYKKAHKGKNEHRDGQRLVKGCFDAFCISYKGRDDDNGDQRVSGDDKDRLEHCHDKDRRKDRGQNDDEGFPFVISHLIFHGGKAQHGRGKDEIPGDK